MSGDFVPADKDDVAPVKPGPNSGPGRAMGKVVASGVAWNGSLYLIETAAQLLFTAVLARLLSPREYGTLAAAMVFIQFANMVSNMGINSAIIQMPVLDLRRQRVAYAVVLTACLFCFVAMQSVAPLAQEWFRIDGLATVVRVLSLIYVAQALGALSQSLLYRDLHSRAIYVTRLFTMLFANIVVAIPLAWFGFGVWALVGATLAQAFAYSIALRFQVKAPLVPLFAWGEARALVRTTGGFTLAEFAGFAAVQADNIIVGRFLGPVALGFYSRAYNLMSLPTAMYGAIAQRVVFPAMARVQDDVVRLRSAFLQGTALTALVGIPLTAFVVAVAPELIRTVFGAQWTAAIVPFDVLSLAMYVRLSGRVSASLLQSRGRLRLVVIVNAVRAALIIAGCLATVPLGLNALAAAVGVVFLVSYGQLAFFACRDVQVTAAQFVRAQLPGVALGLLATALAFGSAFALRQMGVPAIVLLVSDTLVCGIGLLAAVLWLPALFVGPVAAPFVAQVTGFLRRR